MKKLIAILLSVLLTAGLAAGAAADGGEKLSVVTTIFPIYDWVRQVAGDNENVGITLLLDSGVDLHSYQPTAQDILKISSADLFIYVGGESDEWVEDVLEAASNPDLKAISLLEVLGEAVKNEETVEGMEHDHDHDEDEDHEDHEEDEHEDHEEHGEHDHEHEHGEEADEHVWLSLRCARTLVGAIADALCEADAEGAEGYRARAEAYCGELDALDARYEEMVGAAAYDTVLFGDRFPFRYLVDDYGLNYYAAFSGCSAESEASFETVLFLARKMDELGLPAVLTLENAKTRIAQTVVEATQAKNQRILAVDSLQGTTAADVAAGVTYLSVMEDNLEVLREALN